MALENQVFSPFGPHLALLSQVQSNEGWKFDFWQTFKLRLQTSSCNWTKRLCNTTHGTWKLCFLHVQANRVWSLTFGQTSQLRLETSLISSNYISQCNTTYGSWKSCFLPHFGPIRLSHKVKFRPIRLKVW